MANYRPKIDQDEERARIMASSYKVLDHLLKVIIVMERAGFSKAPKTGKVARPLSPAKKQKHHQAHALHMSYLNTKMKIAKLKDILDEMEGQDVKKKKPVAAGEKPKAVPKICIA
ncbi:unnamed protein product [Clonostachys rosea f. rosea IK726]|jgi:hypothetical protein|uniref:Uncharacterized protein n=1 Tax=Clonostachys rosea f. rosea IK726 TaxID=1349383 RepID=A0ACA9THA6_BIOOC|nr:unnamed protein product [Clonostachys rosea f. rosea IK726]